MADTLSDTDIRILLETDETQSKGDEDSSEKSYFVVKDGVFSDLWQPLISEALLLKSKHVLQHAQMSRGSTLFADTAICFNKLPRNF